MHYSGKKKTHTDKNVVIVNRKAKRIAYLSQTYAGTAHDKKIADHEHITYPKHTKLYKDTGFKVYEPHVKQTLQPQKAAAQSTHASNRRLSRIRVEVEHAICGAKRSRCVKDVGRNLRDDFPDSAMCIACGLHNLRADCRKRRLKP